MQQSNKDVLIDLSGMWATLHNGRWALLWHTVLGIVVSGYLTLVWIVPKYSATAVLALETQVQRIDGIQGVVSDMPLAGYSNEMVLFTEIEVLKSRPLMAKVVKKLDLLNTHAFTQEPRNPNYLEYLFPRLISSHRDATNTQDKLGFAIDKLLKSIDINLIPNSFAFHITAHSPDANQARDIANSIANLYIGAQVENKHQATSHATQWLTNRVTELKLDLERNETRVREFDAKTALLTEENLHEREIKLKEMRARAASMKARHDQLFDAIMVQSDDPAVKFKSKDPTMVSSANLRTTVDLDRSKEQLAHLNQVISAVSDSIDAQANDFQTLNQIRREAEASKNQYEFFLSRLKETSIQQGILRADSRLLSQAELPHSVASLSKSLMLLIGAIFGFMAGISFVFFRHAIRQNFHTSNELAQAFDLPIIGAIPKFSKPRMRPMGDIMNTDQTSFASDEMRNLRTALMAMPPQSLMFCSALSGELKSTYSKMLAYQFAILGQRVLLLECDLRRISFQSEFGAPADGSLVDVLQNNRPVDQVITVDEKHGIDILRANGEHNNAADLLARPAFAAMMKKLRAEYDLIVVDAPPVLLFPDARIVAQHCDQVVLNVLAEKTRRADIQQALEILRTTDTNVTGLVLANFDPRKQPGNRVAIERFRYNQSRLRA